MRKREAFYPGAVPPPESVALLFHTWNRRRSGRLHGGTAEVRIIDGEPANQSELTRLLKLLYEQEPLSFHAEPALAMGVRLLAHPLWDAAGRLAAPKRLRPGQTLLCPRTIRSDLPLEQATRDFLGWKERIPLSPLADLNRQARSQVLADLARLVALDALTSHEAPPVREDPLAHPRDLIREQRYSEAIDALVGLKGPDARALTGFAIYYDQNRPPQHRHTAGRMLVKAALRSGSELAKELLPELSERP